jgi:hypothetical protein
LNVARAWISITGIITLMCLLAPRPAAPEFLPRKGYVTLQFDDTHEHHYTHIYPMLEAHGFKGTFAFVTEAFDLGIESGQAWKVQEMYSRGHEIQDHTTRHDYMWATHIDTLNDGIPEWIPYTFANARIWDSLCVRSLVILDSLGIAVTGWNQPGGTKPGSVPGHPEWATASGVSDSLYALIADRYAYAMGNFGVWPHNAHLNLRGHNYPERFPFFNVPHVMVDDLTLAEIKTGMADAVASGLWYCAVDHAHTMAEVNKMSSLMNWLDAADIEVVRCCQGRDRVQFGYWNPLENQLPQARMLADLDGNGKPDGFMGACAWDTVSMPPVDSCYCCRVFGGTDFTCYGPEIGRSAFSFWARSKDTTDANFSMAYAEYGFDWTILGSRVASVQVSGEWTKVDTTDFRKFIVYVVDDVDRVMFRIQGLGEGDTILVAYPELLLIAEAGVEEVDTDTGSLPSPVAAPNPVPVGAPLRVETRGDMRVYDVLGREVMHVDAAQGQRGLVVDTNRLGPGLFLIRDRHGGPGVKVVVLR